MADIEPSAPSTVIVAPIKDSSFESAGRGSEERGDGGEVDVSSRSTHNDVSTAGGRRENIVNGVDMCPLAANDPENSRNEETQIVLQPLSQPSFDTTTTTAQPQPQPQLPVPPLKRFTSVNINKRFLEKTSSTSGTSSAGSLLVANASSGGAGVGSSQRGESPAPGRPSSTDRPVQSRLITAKLTAVPQPSMATTSGWLRNNSSTPSATSTPPSSSPQPVPNGPITTHPQSAPPPGTQQSKRRTGDPPSQNGAPVQGALLSSLQHGSSKPVWGKVMPSQNAAIGHPHGKSADKQINDFPTAAEAAHGRKIKTMNAQLAAETAAALTAAQKQAMNETAAAFRGVHLDPNAHHWDEMEDEDSDFLAGVIEFGDGTQYKIEHKVESVPSQDHPSSIPGLNASQQSLELSSAPQQQVTKEERFGEDFDRSWPRAKVSPVQQTTNSSLPPQIVSPLLGGPHRSPSDGSTSASAHSPQDLTSPASRVLFNERSNRLEPWSNTKPRLTFGQTTGSATRRDSREDHPPFGLRHQVSNRDAPPHSHPSSANQQPMQKATDSAGKGAASRAPYHALERGRWGRDEERPWEGRRKGSVSSADAPGTSPRDHSRDREGRRNRWDGRAPLPSRESERHVSNVSMFPPAPQPRDAGRQVPPHLSRRPPSPIRSREIPPHAAGSHPLPPASVPTHISPTSEKAPSATGAEEVDKDSLVKDAMQLALERAKRRKQEGEEEEKRRLEAVERARKKAETLAAAQEEKKKAQALPPPPDADKSLEPPQILSSETAANGIEVTSKPRETVPSVISRAPHAENALSKGVFSRPSVSRTANLPPGLPQRPSIPPQVTPASQAESWRSKAVPQPSSPPRPPSPLAPPPPPPPHPLALPLTTKVLELDLTFLPDENIEVIDFSDLGKLVGHPSPPVPQSDTLGSDSAIAAVSTWTRRAVASDFFDDRPLTSCDPMPTSKSDMPSWRNPAFKSKVVPYQRPAGEELGTQTMPIFSTDDLVPAREEASVTETKLPSTPSSSPKSNRYLSQSDQALSSSITLSASAHLAAVASRSPRAPSHFKEAPMSTLTDTMSRIKGALDGMQSQESPPTSHPKEKDSPEQRPQAVMTPIRMKVVESPTTIWRENREVRPETSHFVVVPTPPVIHYAPEIFDITRPGPPRSPKPAWNAFMVRLPKESRPRETVSRKQLHFWNLPHPGVRWDILSWEPPVEGMNKRDLSRDEIFHRKYAIKGGRLRVLLPSKRIIRPLNTNPSQEPTVGSFESLPAVITAAGVKIKLPPNDKQKIAVPPRMFYDRPRDSNVPSWRRSAVPLGQIKRDRQSPTSANSNPPDHELNTISRSPPPEPSTPLPQFVPLKSDITSTVNPGSTHSATVSLPMNTPSHSKCVAPKRPSGTDVAFFRTSRGDTEAEAKKPVPRFTVNSELDTGESTDRSLAENVLVDKSVAKAVQLVVNPARGSPQIPPVAEILHPVAVSNKSETKNSDKTATRPRPLTPPSTHTTSAWGPSPLKFSLKESPARSAPDPEHLKAVWSQPSGRTSGTTSNSLKGIADDLPSIPFTVQDMKSEDGETPPPTAPVPPPSRLSLQEVTRAFQQVPGAPAPVTNPASRPPSYAQTPLLPSTTQQTHRSNQAVAISLPPQPSIRGAFAPYPPSMVGHSPSPTMMYAPVHHVPVTGPSPPIAHPMWLATPLPQSVQPATFMRPPPAPIMYPPPATGASPGAPGHMMHRRMSVVSPGVVPPGPNIYSHMMDMQGGVHQTPTHLQSPLHSHTHPVALPPMHMFSPPPHGQAPAMYAVPVGAGRGIMPRPGTGYEGMQHVPHLPHNPAYQPVPPTSFSHPFHS